MSLHTPQLPTYQRGRAGMRPVRKPATKARGLGLGWPMMVDMVPADLHEAHATSDKRDMGRSRPRYAALLGPLFIGESTFLASYHVGITGTPARKGGEDNVLDCVSRPVCHWGALCTCMHVCIVCVTLDSSYRISLRNRHG